MYIYIYCICIQCIPSIKYDNSRFISYNRNNIHNNKVEFKELAMISFINGKKKTYSKFFNI